MMRTQKHTHTLNQPNSFTIDTHNIKWCLVNETGLMTAHLTCAIFHNSRETHKRLIEIHGKNFIKKCKYFRAKVMPCIVQMTFQVVLSVFQKKICVRMADVQGCKVHLICAWINLV